MRERERESERERERERDRESEREREREHSHVVLSLNRSGNLLPSSEQKGKLHPLPSKFTWSKDSPAQYEAQLHSTHVENMID